MAVWNDYFGGTPNARLEDRTPTNSDGSAQTGTSWLPVQASNLYLGASNTLKRGNGVSICFQQDSHHYVVNQPAADRNQTAQIIETWATGANHGTVGVCIDVDSDSGYYMRLSGTLLQIIARVNGVDSARVGQNIPGFTVAVNDLLTFKLQCVDSGGGNLTLTATTTQNALAPVVYTFSTGGDFTYYLPNIGRPGLEFPPSGADAWTAFIATYTFGANTAQALPVLNMGWIGDSNAVLHPAVPGSLGASAVMQQTAQRQAIDIIAAAKGYSSVNLVSRAMSGTTSVDWSNPANTALTFGPLLTNAINYFTKMGVTLVGVQVGTNDSKDAVATTPAAYQANMTTIKTALNAAGIRAVFFYPPFLNSVASGFSTASPARLLSYQAALDAIADGVNFFAWSSANASTTVVTASNLYAWIGAHATDISVDGIHFALTVQGALDAGKIFGQGMQLLLAGSPPVVSPVGLGTTLALSWTVMGGATGYKLYRNGTVIYTGTATSFIDTTPGATPAYTVSGTNAYGEGPQSAPISTTLAGLRRIGFTGGISG